MWGFKFRIEGLYFTSFRNPLTTSLFKTYLVPPFTTIRGLLSNALGLPRDHLEIQEWVTIGIKPVNLPEKSREMAKVLKLKGDYNKFTRTFSSSPMFKEFLVFPSYDIFLGGEEEKIRKIIEALKNPVRPLYIGGSDDLVDIKVDEPLQIELVKSNEIRGIVGGVQEDAVVEKLPYKFHKRGKKFTLDYKVVSIPKNGVIHLEESVEAYRFKEEMVWLA